MTASQIIAKAKDLPQVSQTALRLVTLLAEPDDNFSEAAELIRADSYLTLKLLRACNSAAFGLPERVASVDQALMLIGFDEVRRIVLALGFGNAMARTIPVYSIKDGELWRHAFITATVAEEIVSKQGDANNACVAFTAGLLHDIGKVMMGPVMTPEIELAIQQNAAGNGSGSIQIERQKIGADHAEVGACLLHMWRVPNLVVEAVASHHRPVFSPTPQLSAVTHVANRISHIFDNQPDSARYELKGEEPVAKALNLDQDAIAELLAVAARASKKAAELQGSVA